MGRCLIKKRKTIEKLRTLIEEKTGYELTFTEALTRGGRHHRVDIKSPHGDFSVWPCGCIQRYVGGYLEERWKCSDKHKSPRRHLI